MLDAYAGREEEMMRRVKATYAQSKHDGEDGDRAADGSSSSVNGGRTSESSRSTVTHIPGRHIAGAQMRGPSASRVRMRSKSARMRGKGRSSSSSRSSHNAVSATRVKVVGDSRSKSHGRHEDDA